MEAQGEGPTQPRVQRNVKKFQMIQLHHILCRPMYLKLLTRSPIALFFSSYSEEHD